MTTRHVRLVLDRRSASSTIASPPATLRVSLVVPVKDEADNVPAVAAEITTAMSAAPWSWECVWVDDGSNDGTGLVLERVAREDPRHRLISLPQNVGQSAALAAGLSAARGELFVTLDGDGQNDPGQVPAMVLLLIRSRADMVKGWRRTRSDDLMRQLSCRIASALRRWLAGEEVRDVGCALRVFRREVVQGLIVFRGLHRLLPTLVRMKGATRILEVPVRHRPRLRGKTKYGLRARFWAALADAFAARWLLARTVPTKAPHVAGRGLDQDRA